VCVECHLVLQSRIFDNIKSSSGSNKFVLSSILIMFFHTST
jgi:hypothetical protein